MKLLSCELELLMLQAETRQEAAQAAHVLLYLNQTSQEYAEYLTGQRTVLVVPASKSYITKGGGWMRGQIEYTRDQTVRTFEQRLGNLPAGHRIPLPELIQCHYTHTVLDAWWDTTANHLYMDAVDLMEPWNGKTAEERLRPSLVDGLELTLHASLNPSSPKINQTIWEAVWLWWMENVASPVQLDLVKRIETQNKKWGSFNTYPTVHDWTGFLFDGQPMSWDVLKKAGT